MNYEIKNTVLNKIKEYDKIIIFRHFRPDGDAVGSSRGLREILRLTYPDKLVCLINSDYSEYTMFLGDEDPQEPDEFYSDALGIVMDTATTDRISNQKYKLCRELIKFDHHINIRPYGDYMWVAENRSSTCEMVADFYDTFKDELKINTEAATCIYAGMVTDSGRFRFRDVSGETMRLAGTMLNVGINTEKLYAQLYMRDFESFKFESHIYKTMKITENGVAYAYVSRATQEKFNISFEQACTAVSYMDAIKNSLIWIALIENPNPESKEIRVRLRSRFVTVNELAEKYRGGGHACASGATVYSKAEAKKLLREADERLKEYKENNEGWL